MIVQSVRLHRFELPLKRSLFVANTSVATRQGVLLTVTTDSALTASCEVSPLPGLHRETIGTVITELKEFKRRFTGRTLQQVPDNWWGTPQVIFKDFPAAPSVRFAIETVCLNLWAQQTGKKTSWFLGKPSAKSIRLNALLFGEPPTVIRQAEKYIARGFRDLKIKVARHALQDELDMLTRLLRELPHSVRVRLDANRSWTLEQAKALQSLPKERIEYVEEPLQNPYDIPAFYRATGIPVALDESLTLPKAHELLKLPGVNALVLKPTVLGATETLRWAQWAERQRQKIILSDTFSSGIGLNILAHWAAALNSRAAHGLNTYDLLAEDLLNQPLNTDKGQLKLLPGHEINNRIRWSRLNEL